MSDQENEGRISELCSGILLFLVSFRRAVRHAELDPRVIRHSLSRLFAEFEERAKRDPRTFEYFDKARYLLAVTADDLALGTEWNGARDWEMFEEEFYTSRIGGTKIYEHLEDPTWRSPDMNEVFYMCFAVGFRGKHMIRGQAELDKTRQELYLTLRDVPRDGSKFTPNTYEENVDRVLTRVPVVSVARIAILLVGVLLIVAVGSRILYTSSISDLSGKAAAYAQEDSEERKK